ncbi:hypothetical protein, partial [uncultured Stenotrophomonas sp.]|uniref:hypothetical protein n=1 Tax=uncultured Stenotrophomonas sp. TaxID=165438 RepID=UPI00280648B5
MIVDIGNTGNGGSPDSATGRWSHGAMVSADTDRDVQPLFCRAEHGLGSTDGREHARLLLAKCSRAWLGSTAG